jgi:excinuclease ABC subunit C
MTQLYRITPKDGGTIKSVLTDIKGISETTANKLLIHFKSVKKIEQCSLQEMESIIGASKAALVFTYFKTQHQN